MILPILKGQAITVVLGQTGISTGKHIYLTIVQENGTVLSDKDGVLIHGKILTYDTNTHLYGVALQIDDAVQEQYLRLYFSSTDAVIDPIYFPQDAKLSGAFKAEGEIVPLQYFLDYVLNAGFHVDPLFKQAVSLYVTNNREGVRNHLLSAESTLETEAMLYFRERTINQEKRDYFFDQFSIHLWQFVVSHPPINELVKFELTYANNPIADISPDLFVTDRETGIIEFLPIPSGNNGGLYSLVMQNLSGMAFTTLVSSTLSRIPALFRATYKTGLYYDGAERSEKEAIRLAICNRALRELLPKIDPAMRQASFSESIDGMSTSTSYNIKDTFKTMQEAEATFLLNLRKKYSANIAMVVV